MYVIRDFNEIVYNPRRGTKMMDGKRVGRTRNLADALKMLVAARKAAGNKRVYCFWEDVDRRILRCQECKMQFVPRLGRCKCCCGGGTGCGDYTVKELYYRKRVKRFL